jgi:AraC-like DNA-binding protein
VDAANEALRATSTDGPWHLQAASTLEDYVANPFGRYISGPTYAVYWSKAKLNGIIFWGRPDDEDMRRVTRALDAVLHFGRPHEVLIDAASLKSIDPRAFATMASYMVTHRSVHARLCERQALVRPEGLAGAVVAGFYEIIRPSYPVSVFDEPAAAVRWLSLPDGAGLLRELDRIRVEFQDNAAVVLARVRALLCDEQQDLGIMSLERFASAMAMSPRTLQRRLVDAGTSFRAEVTAARLSLAKHLLANTDYDLKRIAFRVGCSSAAQFSTLFQRLTHRSPTEWRAHPPAGD